MSLLFPLGLIALLSLPIIVLLHLLRARRRRVAVPSLILWRNIPRRPDGQRSSVLPVTLLLLLHLLVALLVGLSLARPQWLGQLLGGGQQLVLVVDTSTSMAAREGSGTRLQAAQSRASSLLNGMGGGDSAVVIAMGHQAQLVARGSVESQQTLLAAVQQLQAGGSGADLRGALTLAEAALDANRRGRIIVLTDSGLIGSSAPTQPVSVPVLWEQIGDAQPNQAIVTLAAQSRSNGTNTPVQVYARVANYSDQSYGGWLRLYGDDQQIDERFVELPPEGESELTWSVPPGKAVLRVQLENGDALAADNTALLSLAQVRPLRVLLVSAAATKQANDQDPTQANNELLRRALSAVPGLSIASVAPDAYAASSLAARADLTVFEDFLPEQWPSGGVLVIAPPVGSQLLPLGESHIVEQVDLSGTSPLLEGLSLGSLRFGPAHRIETPAWASVILAAGDQPLILRGRTSASEIAVWNFALRESNLPSRLAFPVLLSRTIRDLTPQQLPAALEAGSSLQLRPSPRATIVDLTAPDGSNQQQPATSALRFDTLNQPGLYSLTERDASGAVLYNGRVAVNAGAAGESDLRPQPEPQIASAPTVVTSDASQQGRDLWPWFALLALLVVIGEWVYVHRR